MWAPNKMVRQVQEEWLWEHGVVKGGCLACKFVMIFIWHDGSICSLVQNVSAPGPSTGKGDYSLSLGQKGVWALNTQRFSISFIFKDDEEYASPGRGPLLSTPRAQGQCSFLELPFPVGSELAQGLCILLRISNFIPGELGKQALNWRITRHPSSKPPAFLYQGFSVGTPWTPPEVLRVWELLPAVCGVRKAAVGSGPRELRAPFLRGDDRL